MLFWKRKGQKPINPRVEHTKSIKPTDVRCTKNIVRSDPHRPIRPTTGAHPPKTKPFPSFHGGLHPHASSRAGRLAARLRLLPQGLPPAPLPTPRLPPAPAPPPPPVLPKPHPCAPLRAPPRPAPGLLRPAPAPARIPPHRLRLDRAASASDRARLARDARAGRSDNIHVVGDPGFSNPRGSSALAAALHGSALLLRLGQSWDWLVHLDAGDYPLLAPDDLLHVLSYLPRDINFIQHASYIGWKESKQIRPIIVDPGLYLSSRTDIYYATQKRELPSAYKLFTGSSSVILSRKFTEYCIMGTNNLPRTMLMYLTNTPLPHRKYFQTVLCNSPGFNRTVVNHDLHFSMRDESSSKNEPRPLTLADTENMTRSSAAFGTGFGKDDPVLDHIDEEILHRIPGEPAPGGWCIGGGGDGSSPCSVLGSIDVLRPGPAAMRLAKLLAERLSYPGFYSQQCTWD